MGDDEAPPYAEADSNDEMPGGAAGTTPKASPMVPPGEATTSSSERLGVAEFVAGNVPAPNPKAKAAPKKKVEEDRREEDWCQGHGYLCRAAELYKKR